MSGPATPAPDGAAPDHAAPDRAASDRAATDRAARAGGPGTVVLRPRVLLLCAWAGAVAVLVIFVVVAWLLPDTDTGVYFRTADQVSVLVLGVFIAAGLLLMARPRVRADARGVEVRNVGPARWYPWSDIEGVAFPDGSSWARLDLRDDEYTPVLAVQAVDRQRAVDGIRRLRALHRDAVRAAGPADAGETPPRPER